MSVRARFVLLSTARSGTTAIVAALNRHPDAFVHGEAFLPNWQDSLRPEAQTALDIAALRDRPGFGRMVLDYTPGPSVVGFKMWFGQNKSECVALMQDLDVRKIVLSRANRLASYSSMLIARQTGVFHARGDAARDRIRAAIRPARFDAEEFREHVAHTARRFQQYRMRSRGRVFFALYSQIAPGLMRDVQDFVGLDPVDLEMEHRKINGSDILARFDGADHDTIRRTLDDLKKPGWVSE